MRLESVKKVCRKEEVLGESMVGVVYGVFQI
jgi:hypothetical protein